MCVYVCVCLIIVCVCVWLLIVCVCVCVALDRMCVHCKTKLLLRGVMCACVRVHVCVCACMCGITWMPEVVKYGISNLTFMGGLPSLSSAMSKNSILSHICTYLGNAHTTKIT